jgi:uncharacterized membrane protein
MVIRHRARNEGAAGPPGRAMWATLVLLGLITVVSAGIRVAEDWPAIAAGTPPNEDSYEYRYVTHPVLAYAHILPGIAYLLGAPLQLSRRFRNRHFTVHRRLGRVLVPAGILAGIFAIAFGAFYSFGGWPQAVAAVVFGTYFVTALVLAFRAIRRGDVTRHRRWMIRAFAVGLAVGTIRIWIGLFTVFGMSLQMSFAAAFWVSLPLHALAAEIYLSRRPHAYPPARPRLAKT